jgi:hypothetical protein
MLCQRCGDEEGIGFSVQEEWVGRQCLADLERPGVRQRLADQSEREALRRYIKAYGVERW